MVYIYFDIWFPILMVLLIVFIILWSIRLRRLRMARANIIAVSSVMQYYVEVIIICVVAVVISAVFVSSGICLHRRRRRIRDKRVVMMATATAAPVVVTSATHTAPGGYPVTTQMPVGVGPYQSNVYNYPAQAPHQTMQMPMPMPGMPPVAGVQQYPPPMQMPMPAPNASGNMNPPSYDMAVAGGLAPQPNNAGYEKQSPYNPSFTAH